MNRWEARTALKLAVTNVVSRAQKALQVLLNLPLIQEQTNKIVAFCFRTVSLHCGMS